MEEGWEVAVGGRGLAKVTAAVSAITNHDIRVTQHDLMPLLINDAD